MIRFGSECRLYAMRLNITGILLFSLAFVNVTFAYFLKQRSHGHEEVQVPSRGEVDAAIVNLDLHFTKNLCLELLLVDCASHVTKGDEKVCGTDGITYDNHCIFTHAVCEYSTTTQTLKLSNHGKCMTQTTDSVTSSHDNTSKQTTHITSGFEITSKQTTPYVTKDSFQSSFLCTYVNSMNCNSLGVDITCGSDGRRYVNRCELAKETCLHPSLKAVDLSNCH